MAKLIAPAWYGSLLASNPDISQKYKIGDISKRVANTLQPAKKYTKNMLKFKWLNAGIRYT
jgi:hypothetical protein